MESTGSYPRVHVDTAKVTAVGQAGGILLTPPPAPCSSSSCGIVDAGEGCGEVAQDERVVVADPDGDHVCSCRTVSGISTRHVHVPFADASRRLPPASVARWRMPSVPRPVPGVRSGDIWLVMISW